ncbi:peptidoglycan DD-metalloendopeptidase family protein [Sporomusa aerivorans]|uniref:peptidoglycan DD-metalloendopeptidase family protein n=1 Tax=Sporomusa aerivorans TaxID=204936 RepID=UPI00352B321E
MPKEIWSKITGFGYTGQVLTAGILLAVTSLLMFTVFSTLAPAAKPHMTKTTPITEGVASDEQHQSANMPRNGGNMSAGAQEPTAATQLESIADGAAVSQKDTDNRNAAMRDLWQGGRIQDFGWQLQPVYKDWRYHNGIDISGGEGQVVPALLDGEVLDIYTDRQYGLSVAVKSGQYIIYYGSLATSAVSKNTLVKTGSLIGSMGISFAEPEPHLHLAVRKSSGQEYINPREIFPEIPD